MKEAAMVLSLALLLVVGIYAFSHHSVDQGKYFTISILQNSKVVEVKDGVVQLAKAPFQMVFTMNQPMNLMVLASHKTTWSDPAKRGVALDDMIHPGLGFADTLFNSRRNLYLSDIGMNYWFYSEEKDHRFDEVAFQGTTIVGVRTVENLYYPEKDQQIKVENCSERTINLVIAYAHFNEQSQTYSEKQRQVIKIEFY